MKYFILIFLIVFYRISGENSQKSDIIIFSFDRPLQLCGLLDSIDTFVENQGNIFILYRTTNSAFEKAYDQAFKEFKKLNIKPIKQGNQPRTDFKPLLLKLLGDCTHNHILFATDDCLFIRKVDLSDCIVHLEDHKAYSFNLGLGKNIIESQVTKLKSPLPAKHIFKDHYIRWTFNDAVSEWRYPNALDRSLYRKIQIIKMFNNLQFTSPNTLEAQWAIQAETDGTLDQTGVCFDKSKMINVPFNMVQQDWSTPHMGLSTDEFLAIFTSNRRMDIQKYSTIVPRSPHVELPLYLKN